MSKKDNEATVRKLRIANSKLLAAVRRSLETQHALLDLLEREIGLIK